jgi:hypothetical protein
MSNTRKCNYCGKEYTVYDLDAGSYKEWFCSKLCEQAQEDFIDEQLERFTKDNNVQPLVICDHKLRKKL